MITVGNIYAGLNQSGGGGAVVTANGISGDGSVGTPVILGGNPLNQDTIISILTFVFGLVGSAGESIEIGSGIIDLNYTNAGTDDFVDLTIGPNSGTGARVNLQISDSVNSKVFSLDTDDGNGVFISDDIDNIGLNGNVLFPKSGSPNQYAQYGHIPAPGGLPTTPFSANSESSSIVIVDISTALTATHAYRISAALFADIVAGATVQLFVDYTGFDTVSRSVAMGPALTATGDATYPPLTLICFANTDLSVRAAVVNVVGSLNYDVIGIIEDLGTF